jgi:hypothetical protein
MKLQDTIYFIFIGDMHQGAVQAKRQRHTKKLKAILRFVLHISCQCIQSSKAMFTNVSFNLYLLSMLNKGDEDLCHPRGKKRRNKHI